MKVICVLSPQVTYGDETDSQASWAGFTRAQDEVSEDKDHWTVMRPAMAEELFLFFHNLQQNVDSKHKTKSGH